MPLKGIEPSYVFVSSFRRGQLEGVVGVEPTNAVCRFNV